MKVHEITESKIEEGEFRGSNTYEYVDEWNNYHIYVSKKRMGKVGNPQYYIAAIVNPKKDEAKFKEKSKESKEEAVEAVKAIATSQLALNKPVSGNAVIDFNSQFAENLLRDPEETFYAKFIEGPKLVIASDSVAEDPELLKAGEFKTSKLRRKNSPVIGLTRNQAKAVGLKANGRYIINGESTDEDENRVYNCELVSIAADQKDRERLPGPGFTVGSSRK